MNTNMLLLILMLICWSNRINTESCNNTEDIGNIREGGIYNYLQVCGNYTEDNGTMLLDWLYICNDDNSWGVNEANVLCGTYGYPAASGGVSQRAIGMAERNGDDFRSINCGFSNLTHIIDCKHTQASGDCMALYNITCLPCTSDTECGGGDGVCNSNGRCECTGDCENGRYCYLGTCVCPIGFTGSTCEECNPICQINGTCQSDGTCLLGFSVDRCQKCDPICQNNGTCQSNGTCECLPGLIGDRCQECDTICQNNGIFQDNINGTCICNYPYYGIYYCENTTPGYETTAYTNAMATTTLSSTTAKTTITDTNHTTTIATSTKTSDLTANITTITDTTSRSPSRPDINTNIASITGVTSRNTSDHTSRSTADHTTTKTTISATSRSTADHTTTKTTNTGATSRSTADHTTTKTTISATSRSTTDHTTPKTIIIDATNKPDLTTNSQTLTTAFSAVIVVLFISILIILVIATIIITILLVKRNRRNKIVQENSNRNIDPLNSTEKGMELSSVISNYTYINNNTTDPTITSTSNEPMYETVNTNVTNEPMYETVNTNVTNEPTYETVNTNFTNEPTYETVNTKNHSVLTEDPSCEMKSNQIKSIDLYKAFTSTVLNSYVINYSNTKNSNEKIYWEPKDTVNQISTQMSENQFLEISRDSILFEKKLGSGQFGEVFHAQWNYEFEGSMKVAVKILKNNSTQALQTAFMKEAAIMGQFDHPNIIKLLGVVSQSQPYMIVTELMETELLQFISSALKNQPMIKTSKVQQHFSAILLKFTREIASGMRYLSSKQFIHRDLAARNILIGRDLVCRISDFGMSRELRQESDYYKSQGGIIPVRWCSPEAVFYKRYSEKSDVWSYGMTLYEMWTLGKKPWNSYSINEEVLRALEVKEILPPPAGCPRAIYSIMVDTWNPNPEARVDFEYLVNALSGEEAELLKNNNPNTTTDDANTGGNEEECYLIGCDPNTALSMYRDVQLRYSIP